MSLLDPNGEVILSGSHEPLEDPRVLSPIEVTALISGIMGALATVHGNEVVQLIAIRAEAAERAITQFHSQLEGEPYLPPTPTDEDIARWEAEEES